MFFALYDCREGAEVTNASGQFSYSEEDAANSSGGFVLPLPPGIEAGAAVPPSRAVDGMKTFVPVTGVVTSATPASTSSNAKPADASASAAVKRRPPPGPPPAWALQGNSAAPTKPQPVTTSSS